MFLAVNRVLGWQILHVKIESNSVVTCSDTTFEHIILCRSWRLLGIHPQLHALIKPSLVSPQLMNACHCLELPHSMKRLQTLHSTAGNSLPQPGDCIINPTWSVSLRPDHHHRHSHITRLNCWSSRSHITRPQAHLSMLCQCHSSGSMLCQRRS